MRNNRRASLFMLMIMLMSIFVQLATAIGTIQAYAETGGRDITTLDGAGELKPDKNGNKTIITDVKMMINNNGYLEEISESRPLKVGEIFEIEYKIEIPNELSAEIEKNDFFDFKLPNSDDIKLTQEQSGPMIDPDNGQTFGSYVAQTDGNVKITFNDQIKDLKDVDGQLNFRVQLQQHTITIPGGHTIEVPYVSTTDGVVIFVQGNVDYYILKEYIGREGNDLKWKILINPNYNHITNLKLFDVVTTSDKPDSITVDKMIAVDTDLQGNVTQGEEISIADNNVDMSNGRINLGFDEINEPYQLFVTTSFSNLPGEEVTNKIELEGTINDQFINPDSIASATVSGGPVIEKKVLSYDKKNQIVKWEVIFNSKQANISQEDAYFEDVITNGTVIRDSFEVSQYYGYDIDFAADDTSFKFSFQSDVSTVVVITYETRVTDMNQPTINNKIIYNGPVVEVEQNTNGDDDGEDGDGTSTIEKTVHSGNGTIAKWDLNINKERQKVDKWSVTDRVDSGNIRMDTFELKNLTTDSSVPESEYTIEWHDENNGKAKGFTVNYDQPTNNNFVISYYTDIERNTNQSNHAYYYYFVDGEEKEDDDSKTTPSFALKEPTLSKSGRYIPETHEIEWTVTINDVEARQRGLMGTEQLLEDPLLEEQKYVEDSVEVFYSNYGSWEPNIYAKTNFNDELNQIEIRDFTDYVTDTPQKVVFRTKLENPYDILDKEFENIAYYTDANTRKAIEAKASLKINNANDLLLKKEGSINGSNSNLIDWNVEINPYSYTLDNLVIYDESWENQVVLRETIQLKEALTQRILVEGLDYTLDYTERYFTITMKDTVTQTLYLTYQGQILFPYGTPLGSQQQVKNSVRVTGDRIIKTEKPIEVVIEVQVPESSGTIQGRTRDLNVKKVSKDNPNETLQGAEFTLYRGTDKDPGKVVNRVETNEDGIATFTKLSKGDYLLVETRAPEDFAISNEMKNGRIVTINDNDTTTVEEIVANPRDEEEDTTEFPVEKKWENIPENVETPDVEINLYANGNYKESMTLNEGNDYQGVFTDLPKSEDGEIIEYTVDEDVIPNYEVSIDGGVITNTFQEKFINISGEKIWEDDNDEAEKRPDKITIELYQNDEFYDDIEVYGTDNWKYEFKNLPEINYETWEEYEYHVQEVDIPEDYESKVDGYNIINKLVKPKTTELTGEKIWDDNNNELDKRPDSIKVQLFRDGEFQEEKKVTSNDNWEYTFTDLLIYNEEEERDYVYTVKEKKVPQGYETSVEDNDIVNTLIEVVSLSGEKIWEDGDDDSLRPDSIDIQLYQNDEPYEIQTINSGDQWAYKFTDLPKFEDKEKNNPYHYRVEEVNVPEAYESEVEGNNVINTLKEPEIQYTEISGEKFWNDNDNILQKRPESIKVYLYQNDDYSFYREQTVTPVDGRWTYKFSELPLLDEEGEEYVYTVKEAPEGIADYNSEIIDEYDLENTFKNDSTIDIEGEKIWFDEDDEDEMRPESITVRLFADGTEVADLEVTENDHWYYKFEAFPEFNDELKAIKYEVTEDEVEGYETEIDGTTITNTHKLVDKFDIEGEKIWQDYDNELETRPDEVTIKLLRNNKNYKQTTTSEGENWYYKFTDLLVNDEDGNEYTYSVKEVDVPDGYDSYIDDFNIVNKLIQYDLIDIIGEKYWKDSSEEIGIRPDSIDILLQMKNESNNWEAVERQSISANENGHWEYEFSNQPKYHLDENNHQNEESLIEYRVVELDKEGNILEEGDSFLGYQVAYDEFDITNAKEFEKISVAVKKNWIEPNNTQILRPKDITVRLFQDGVEIDKQILSSKDNGSSDNLWEFKWTDLDKRNPDTYETYDYEVREDTVPNYQTQTESSKDEEGNIEYILNNTFKSSQTVDVSGEKYWDDKGFEGNRPNSITVDLYQDSHKFKSQKVTESEDGTWTYHFNDLPVHDDKTGEEYLYSIKESNVVDGYESTVLGYDITNTYLNDDVVSVSGEKIWVDYDNAFETRPDEITVSLYQDSKFYENKVVTKGDDWKYSFTDLPKFKDKDTPYVYTIREGSIPSDYTSEVEGNNIVNTYQKTNTIDISGEKFWDDWDGNNNGFQTRPSEIEIELLQNGNDYQTQIVKPDESGDWKYTFSKLPEFDILSGDKYEYEIKEKTVLSDYESTVSGYDIYNKYQNTDTTEISVLKKWDDNDNNLKLRPTEIKVHLLRNGKKQQTESLSEKNSWTYKFDELAMYDNNGDLYSYTIVEDTVNGYSTTYEITDNLVEITNKLNENNDLTSISGQKIWDDYNNEFELRPASITVVLMDGENELDEKIITEKDGWRYEFTDLEKGKNYTVKEREIGNGYVSKVEGTNITNTYRNSDKIQMKGKKVWKDYNNQFLTRPESFDVNLIRDGSIIDTTTALKEDDYQFEFKDLPKYDESGKAYTYEVAEIVPTPYTSDIEMTENGNDISVVITNTYKNNDKTSISGEKIWNDFDGTVSIRPTVTVELIDLDIPNSIAIQSKALTEADGWQYEFDNLPKYNEEGKEINYGVREVLGFSPDYYESAVIGHDIVNTYVSNLTFKGEKIWNDYNNYFETRPDEVTIYLLAGNTKVDKTTTNATDHWKYTFDKGYPVYNEMGEKIVYRVLEEDVQGYTSLVSGNVAESTITNTYINTTKTRVEGSKTWNDFDNQLNTRPKSITVKLLQDGNDTGQTKIVSEATNWAYAFEDLAVYAEPNGNELPKEYVYTVVEEPIEGYTQTQSGPYFINKSDKLDDKTFLMGEKIWRDENNVLMARPDSVTVVLYQNNRKMKDDNNQDITQKVGLETQWKYRFNNLPKYADDGSEFIYTVKEQTVAGYETSYFVKNDTEFDIINTYVNDKLIDLSGKKVWDDFDNKLSTRPESITIEIYQNNSQHPYDILEVTADEKGDWSYEFTDLPKYDKNLQEIIYTVKEQAVPHYDSDVSADGTEIKNTYRNNAKTEVSGEKVWLDGQNKLGTRPESIKINLYQNNTDTPFETKEVSADENGHWLYEFTNLPKYDNELNEFTYHVEEVVVPNYQSVISEIDHTTITNTFLNNDTTSLKVVKKWDDQDNKLETRPGSIFINLYRNNSKIPYKVQRIEPDLNRDWSYEFTDLPKYDNALNPYVYTAKEVRVPNYKTETEHDELTNTTTITNSYLNTTKTSVHGTKAWKNDFDNKLNTRPESISIDLYRIDPRNLDKEEFIDTTVVTPDEEGYWSYSFTNLEKYNSELDTYIYLVKEKPVAHYEVEIEGSTVINTYQNTDKVTLNGEKKWVDVDNKLGTRPESIEVELYQNDDLLMTKTVTAGSDDRWTYEFTDLAKYDNQLNEYEYTIKEPKVAGYETQIEGIDITNTYQNTAKTNVVGRKVWDDQNNKLNTRPNIIKIDLYQNNGEKPFKSQFVRANGLNEWTYMFTDLPKYDEKLNEYIYTVKEQPVLHYNSDVSETTITNTYINDSVTSIRGEKLWDDQGNKLNSRPQQIYIDLYQGESRDVFATEVVEADENGHWAYEFTNLPKYDEELNEYEYHIKEREVPHYDSHFNGTTITNIYQNTDVTSVNGVKTWDDENNKLETRPESIFILLYQTTKDNPEVNENQSPYKMTEVKADENNEWKYEFSNLPKYDDNLDEYIYIIKEHKVVDYDETVNGYYVHNKYQNKEVTKISGNKVWNDEKNKINSRPESITVNLYQSGSDDVYQMQTITPDAKGNWSYEFTDLPKYNELLDEYVYSVKEVAVDHYEAQINGFDIINTYQNTDLISVDGQKQWNDYDDKLKQRPESIVVELYRNDSETPFKVQEVKAGENNDWSYSFKDLPKYDDDLNEYEYTVKEREVADYQTTIEGTTIINTFKNVETVKVEGEKLWEDLDNKLQVRPTSILIDLYQNDEKTPFRTQEITADADGNWYYEFNDLPKYDNSLDEITYTVKEQEVLHYNSQVTGTTITNTYRNDDQTSVKGEKVWQDKDNKLSSRPKSITIDLYQNDGEAVYKTVEVTADKDGNWNYEFNNLPKYDDELNEFIYTVKEREVPHYTSTVDDTTITNTYRNDDTTIIEGEKIWQDEDNKLNLRPKSIIVELYQNDDSEPFKMKRVTSDKDGNWRYDFKDLPKYDDELNEFTYTVKEQDVYHYDSQVEGTNITNTYRNDDLTSINGEKKWKDQDDKLKVRPQSITIELYQNDGDKPYQSKEVTPDSDGDWLYEFKELPKYDDKLNEFNYTVKELVVDHYDSQVKGTNITNTYRNDDVTTLEGQKQWNDYDDKLKQRPESIVVELYQNNSQTPMKTQEVKAGENNDWRYEFTDLPKYDADLNEYHYKVKEQEVTDYQTTIEGTTIINTFKNVETIKVEGEKLWDDLDNKLSSRPEFIIVDLYQNDEEEAYRSQKVVPNENGDWTYEFNDLPKYDTELTAITYTVKEQTVDHYDSEVEGTTITNTYRNDETTTIAGEKTWEDENDKLHLRPDSITVELYQNDDEKAYQSLVVTPTDKGDWNYEFTDLPKYDEELNEITYTVKEKEVTYYDSQVEGTNIKNTYRNEDVTSITGQKLWQDDDNKGKTRPSAITVEIYQNDSKKPFKSQKVTPDKNGNWTFTFDNLPKYDEQLNTYTYTVDEVSVKGYSTKVEGTTITNTLEKEPEKPVTPTNPKDGSRETAKNKSYLPQTGENNQEEILASLIGVTLVSMIAGVVVLRKKYYN